MNEEFLKKKQERLGVPLDELKAKWAEFEQNGKEMGFEEGTALEDHVKFRISKYYLKLEREPIMEGKFQPLCVDKTDYGVMRQFQKATEAFNVDAESAIKDGLVDSRGLPLHQSGFNKGNPINLNIAFTIVYDGYFIPKDKEDKIKCKYRLGGDDVNAISFELGNIYEIKGIKSQKQSDDGSILIIGKRDYMPKLIFERDFEDVRKDLSEFFSENLVNMTKISEYCKMKNDDGDKYPIAVVRGNVYQLTVINNKEEDGITIERNNRIELMVEDEDYEIHTIGGWVPKIPELDFNFSENAQNVIMIGTVRQREDKQTKETITEFSKVTGIFVPKEFRKTGEEKKVEDTEEITDDDVKEFVDSQSQTLI